MVAGGETHSNFPEQQRKRGDGVMSGAQGMVYFVFPIRMR